MVWGPAQSLCLHQGPLLEEPRSSLTRQPCHPVTVTPTLRPLPAQRICLSRTSLGSDGGPPPPTGLLNLETLGTNACSPGWTSALLCPASQVRDLEVSNAPHLAEGGSFKLRADPGPWSVRDSDVAVVLHVCARPPQGPGEAPGPR